MRNLFLALVLSNLAFAAWHAWFAPLPPGRPMEPTAPPIRLISEVEGAAETGAQGEAEGPAGSGSAAADQPADAGTPVPADRSTGAGIAVPADQPAGAGAPVPADRSAGSGASPATDGSAATGATEDPAAASLDAALAAPPGALEGRCVSVGPFSELSEAATASAKLRAVGYDPTQRIGEGDIWVGYWVYIDAIPSRAEANAMLAALEAGGITGPYVIPGEEDGDIISLGVFSEIARAGRLRDQVRELGYEPEVVDRTRRGTVYWIDILLGAGRELDFEALQTPGRITRLEQRPCERPPA